MGFESLQISEPLKKALSSSVNSGRFPHAAILEDEDGERLICPASNGMFRPILVDRGRLVAVRPVGEGLLWKGEAAPSARVARDVNRAVSRMEQRLAG